MLSKFMQQRALALMSSPCVTDDRKVRLSNTLARSGIHVEVRTDGPRTTIKTTPVVTKK